MTIKNLLAALVTVCFCCATIPAYAAPSEDHKNDIVGNALMVPPEFAETPEDKIAWLNLMDVIDAFNKNYHRRLTGKEMAERFLGSLDKGFDPHTIIMNAQEVQTMLEGQSGAFGGIGVRLNGMSSDLRSPGVLISVIKGGPAEKVGMHDGDIITHISIGNEFKAIPSMRNNDVVNHLRGGVGTALRLQVFRPGVEMNPIIFMLTRELVQIPFVESALKSDGFGYVRVTSFALPLAEQLKLAVEDVRGKHVGPMRGWVLDLRDNPGGLVGAVDNVLDEILLASRYSTSAERLVIRSSEARGHLTPDSYVEGTEDIFKDEALLILVNSQTASAAEILASTLQFYGRAIVAGATSTYGKGSMQSEIPLETGGMILMTTHQYLIGAAGCEKPIQGVGVQVDIPLQITAEKASDLRREVELPFALQASTLVGKNCTHHFAVSPEQRAMSYEMLKVMGLSPLEPKK